MGVAFRVHIGPVPAGWMWQKLNEHIKEGQAVSLGHRTYEFGTYGDACSLLATCDALRVPYTTDVESDD